MNNAWRREIKEAAYLAITLLHDARGDRARSDLTAREINQIMEIINQNLGQDFAAAVTSQTKVYIDRALRLGLQDVRTELRGQISIGLWNVRDQPRRHPPRKAAGYWQGLLRCDVASANLTTPFPGFTRDQLADA